MRITTKPLNEFSAAFLGKRSTDAKVLRQEINEARKMVAEMSGIRLGKYFPLKIDRVKWVNEIVTQYLEKSGATGISSRFSHLSGKERVLAVQKWLADKKLNV